MTRFRLYSTVFVLTTGTVMGAMYIDPGSPAAPERIDASTILPDSRTYAPSDKTAAARRGGATESETGAHDTNLATPPTVAVPAGPLLRSATSAPPIDTSSNSLSAAPVRHLPDEDGMTIRALPEGEPDSLGQAAAGQPLTGAPSAIGRPAPRRAKPRAAAVRHSRRVEQLFLNPLGTR